MEDPAKIMAELPYFTGTERWWRHDLAPGYLYTDGVRYLAQAAEAYWLLSVIFSYQPQLEKQGEDFQVWTLTVENNKGVVVATDGNDKELVRQEIPYTDFPLKEITLWMEGNVLLLPSEH